MAPTPPRLAEPLVVSEPQRPPSFWAIPWRWRDLVPPLLVALLIHEGSRPWLSGAPAWFGGVVVPVFLVGGPTHPPLLAQRRGAALRWATLREMGRESAIALGLTPLRVASTYGVILLAQRLVEPGSGHDPVAALAANPGSWGAVAVVATVFAPPVEELFYRGMFSNRCRRSLPRGVAALVVAVVFAASHDYTHPFQVGAAWDGLVFCALYEWRWTLTAPIILHALHNLATVGGVAAGLVHL